MKKMIAIVSVFALVAFASSAFAVEEWFGGDTSTSIKVTNDNTANIWTKAASLSNTGGNTANGSVKSKGGYERGCEYDCYGHDSAGSIRAAGGNILTGDAFATTAVLVVANETETDITAPGCGCERDGDMTTWIQVHNNNYANVGTTAVSVANTGLNTANGSVYASGDHGSIRAKGGNIMTGNADATTEVGVVVNSTVTTIR